MTFDKVCKKDTRKFVGAWLIVSSLLTVAVVLFYVASCAEAIGIQLLLCAYGLIALLVAPLFLVYVAKMRRRTQENKRLAPLDWPTQLVEP